MRDDVPRDWSPGAEASDAPLRVLHVPGGHGGHPQGLARAERELGLDSRSLVFEASPFGYEADEVVLGLAPTLADRARLEAFRFRLLARALAGGYDVVHFNFGQSLFPRPIVPGLARGRGLPGAAAAALPRLVGTARHARPRPPAPARRGRCS